MDDEERPEVPEAGEATEKVKKKRPWRRLLTVVITLLLAAAALLSMIYSDRLGSDKLKELLGAGSGRAQEAVSDFSYENGSNQTFARAGDGFAVASAAGIQLLTSDGKTVFKQITSMDTPAVDASEARAVFFDVGGSLCKAVNFDGECVDVDAGERIISASVNGSGYFAVISEEPGSKGLVRVFDRECRLVYEWYSGVGYVVKALISPDNGTLAVLCLTEDGSAIHIFRLGSEKEQALISYGGMLLFDMYFMRNDRLCAIGEDAIVFSGTDGAALGEYGFAGKYLIDYDFGSADFAAVFLSDYRSGSGGDLMSFDSAGELLGSAPADGIVNGLSANGRQLLVVYAERLSLYSQSMALQSSAEHLFTAKKALLRSKGDTLLCSSYSAELLEF